MSMLPASKLEKVIDRELKAHLASYGFKREKGGGCYRWDDDRYTYIGCVVAGSGKYTRVKPFGQAGLLHIQKVYSRFMADDPIEACKRAVTIQGNYSNFRKEANAHIKYQSEDDLPKLLSELFEFVDQELLPWLDSMWEPKKIIELYINKDENKPRDLELPVWHGAGSALTVLIVSALHAPDLFPALYERYKCVIGKLNPKSKVKAEKLVEYLHGLVASR